MIMQPFRRLDVFLGVMLESGRCLSPGDRVPASPTSPNAFGVPGLIEKSSMVLLRRTPVLGIISPVPKNKLIEMVPATRLPSASSTENASCPGLSTPSRCSVTSRSATPCRCECSSAGPLHSPC